MAIDMETATIFMTGFVNEIPTGALLLVSDQPMMPEGVKTAKSDAQVDANLRQRPPEDRHRLPQAAHQQGPHGEAPEILKKSRDRLFDPRLLGHTGSASTAGDVFGSAVARPDASQMPR